MSRCGCESGSSNGSGNEEEETEGSSLKHFFGLFCCFVVQDFFTLFFSIHFSTSTKYARFRIMG